MAVAERDEAALAREHFCAEFPAVLAGHGALEAFHDRAHWRVVRGELFGAILDGDVGSDAPEFVVRAFVGFLESSPPADVVHEDRAKVRLAAFDRPEEVLQCIPALNAHAALARVGEGAHDGYAACVRESLDGGVLVFCRVLLVVGRHADVLFPLLTRACEWVRRKRSAATARGSRHTDACEQAVLPGHSPLYDGRDGTPEAMFFTGAGDCYFLGSPSIRMSSAVAMMFFTRSSALMRKTLAGQAFRSIATLFFTRSRRRAPGRVMTRVRRVFGVAWCVRRYVRM